MQEGQTSASPATAPEGSGRSSVKGWVIGGVVLVALAGAGVAWWLLGFDGSTQATTAGQTSLAEVVTADMQEAETLEGTLGFSEEGAIGSGGAGGPRWATPAGTVGSRGGRV